MSESIEPTWGERKSIFWGWGGGEEKSPPPLAKIQLAKKGGEVVVMDWDAMACATAQGAMIMKELAGPTTQITHRQLQYASIPDQKLNLNSNMVC